MTVPAPPPAPQGYGKSAAALAAGFVSTILIGITNGVLGHYQQAPLDPTMTGAIQGLLTLAAVYLTPHNLGS